MMIARSRRATGPIETRITNPRQDVVTEIETGIVTATAIVTGERTVIAETAIATRSERTGRQQITAAALQSSTRPQLSRKILNHQADLEDSTSKVRVPETPVARKTSIRWSARQGIGNDCSRRRKEWLAWQAGETVVAGREREAAKMVTRAVVGKAGGPVDGMKVATRRG
jgi:hypothetical protein